MPITAEQVQALRRRHADAERKRAEAAGRHASALETAIALEQRMRDEHGCADLAALDALIVERQAALDAALAATDAALAEAEAALR